MKKLIIIGLSVSLLTACGESRDAKDKKLALGCQAGVKSLLSMDRYDRNFDRVKTKAFASENEGRRVNMTGVTKNKQYGYEQDEKFNCLFAEGTELGPFGYKAEIQQINVGDETIGKKDGQILGDLNDFMEITGAVAAALK